MEEAPAKAYALRKLGGSSTGIVMYEATPAALGGVVHI
jgi:hypothetical protein